MRSLATLFLAASLTVGAALAFAHDWDHSEPDRLIRNAFQKQHIRLTQEQIAAIRDNVHVGSHEACENPKGNSKVGFSAVEIAQDLGLNPKVDDSVVDRITEALESLAHQPGFCSEVATITHPSWDEYFKQTISMTENADFLSLLRDKSFFPVKISWEDIGRYENSVWGDRISDVGIWVRKQEHDPDTAELTLSVRRDSNYRDKVLLVPADKIKVHVKRGDKTVEYTLPQRLTQLGLQSKTRDRNVIVSNQFAIVPVPAKHMQDAAKAGHPPRAAFNFSIYPYGSTNFVITDVIEGSSDAIVGPGQHQMLFANINGKKAPFTASRAEDRQDLLKLERDLKAKGMDVDVQRYYLIQIPLKKDADGVELSNMGNPPLRRFYNYGAYPESAVPAPQTLGSAGAAMEDAMPMQKSARRTEPGLNKVAIGHGDTEGLYKTGSGYRGMRAEEPIRVTVVYFVTPVGEITQKDMDAFTKAFEAWDSQAIWGGSFVVKDQS